jgi:hypothetical protein
LTAKLFSVFSMGSLESYDTAATCPPSRSWTTIDFKRSLMSAAWKDRSMRASPSTVPSRRK